MQAIFRPFPFRPSLPHQAPNAKQPHPPSGDAAFGLVPLFARSLVPWSLVPSSLVAYSFADTIRTGPSSPEGSSGESALYGAKSLNVYFFTA